MRKEDLLTAGVATALVLFVPALFVLSDYAVDEAPYCEAKADRAYRAEVLRASPGEKDKAAGKNDGGTILKIESKLPGLSVICRGLGGSAGGRMTWLLAGIAAAFAALAALLARRSAVEERGAKRGRLVAQFADADYAVLRIVNIGESAAWLTGIGWSRPSGRPATEKLKAVSRHVPKGGEDGADFPFNMGRLVARSSFAILWRYKDAYEQEWHAWRVFRMGSAGDMTVEEDGECPADEVDWRRHRGFPLLSVLFFLSSSSSSH